MTIDELEHRVLAETPDLPRAPGTEVTIVFSDIEGSTRLLTELGDEEWLRVLRWHNQIVRDAVVRHGGVEVKAQGDGFMLAFPSASDAAACALTIRSALGDRSPPDADVRVRIGMHAGPVTKDLSDDDRTTVHLAARISSAASGGEILVSSTVHAHLSP